MKIVNVVAGLLAMVFLLTGCGAKPTAQIPTTPVVQAPVAPTYDNATQVVLRPLRFGW